MGKRRQSLRGKGIGKNIGTAFLELGLEKDEREVSSQNGKTMPSVKEEKVCPETEKPKEKKEAPKTEAKVAESASEEKKIVSEKKEAPTKAKKAEPVLREKPEKAKIEERKTSSQTEETKSGLEKEKAASEKKNSAIAKVVEKPVSKEKPVKTGEAEPDYKSEIIKEPKPRTDRTDFEDELFDYAREIVIKSGQASTSMLQRRLRIDYSRAVRLIDMLKERGELPEQN